MMPWICETPAASQSYRSSKNETESVGVYFYIQVPSFLPLRLNVDIFSFKFSFWIFWFEILHFAGHSAPYFRKLFISAFFAFKFPAFLKEIMSVPYILSPRY